MSTSDMRKGLLAKVHVAKKQLGLSDDDYRAVLDERFGVRSAADLSNRDLDTLLRHFSRRGFAPTTRKGRRGDKAAPRLAELGRTPMLAKIEALLAELGRITATPHMPWDYALGILKRMKGPDRLEWATDAHLRAVIAALDKRLKTLEQRALKQDAAGFTGAAE